MSRLQWNVIYRKAPMKWLPKEKRNTFIIVVLIAAAILALIYFGLIHSQNTMLSRVADSRKSAGDKLLDMENAIKNAGLTGSFSWQM